MEAQATKATTFATLTYDDAPTQLQLDDLQRYYKRLRKALAKQKDAEGNPRRFRHFSAGEYGEKNDRPHYHALMFGIHHEHDRALLEKTWGHGFIRADPVNLARIHYVVGYTDKKRGDHPELYEHEIGVAERLDRATGEITRELHKNYLRAPPFRVMSKNPGIGARGKEWRNSWRTHAILEGRTIPVPRFLKEHWKKTATEEEKEQREEEIRQRANTHAHETAHTWEEAKTEEERERAAAEEIHRAKNSARRARRR